MRVVVCNISDDDHQAFANDTYGTPSLSPPHPPPPIKLSQMVIVVARWPFAWKDMYFFSDSQIKVFGLSSHDLQPWEIWSQEVHLHHKGESIAALCSKHHFCFICKNFLQHFFTPGPPALTFAVPLCILNGIFLPILVMTGEFYRTMDIGFRLSTPRTRMWLHRWYSSAPVTAYVRAYVRTSFLLTLTVLRSLMWY